MACLTDNLSFLIVASTRQTSSGFICSGGNRCWNPRKRMALTTALRLFFSHVETTKL